MAEAGGAFSMCGLRGGSVLVSGLPLVREQFGQPALGVSADALKQIAQISEGVDSESLRSCDEAAEHGGGAPAVVATIKHPVFAFMEVLP